MTRKLVGAILLIGLIGSIKGCKGGEAAVVKARKVDSAGGTVALGLGNAPKYRPVTLSANGSVGGTILLQGVLAIPAVPGEHAAACGDSATVAAAMNASGVTPISGVLVWIDSIGTGKPMPSVRRATIEIDHCRFVPSLIAVARGTTINVFSQDRMTHTSRFYREPSNESIEEIHTVDAGQVVPSEKIASQAGIVEVRHVEHPWVRGYIAVFDHPYFAVTDERGGFRIDSLPPGTYTVKVWHERLKAPAEQRVVVSAGGVGRLELMLTAK